MSEGRWESPWHGGTVPSHRHPREAGSPHSPELLALPQRSAGCTRLSLLSAGCPDPPGQHSPGSQDSRLRWEENHILNS